MAVPVCCVKRRDEMSDAGDDFVVIADEGPGL